jgi:hypothetical protein
METPPGSPPRNQMLPAMPHLIRRELGTLNQVAALEREVNRLHSNVRNLQEQITPGRPSVPRVKSNKNLTKPTPYSPTPKRTRSKSSSNLSKMR